MLQWWLPLCEVEYNTDLVHWTHGILMECYIFMTNDLLNLVHSYVDSLIEIQSLYGTSMLSIIKVHRSTARAYEHHRIFLGRGGTSWVGAWWILVFVLIWFPSLVEIQIMCDMYMDEVGIPMLVTMSK